MAEQQPIRVHPKNPKLFEFRGKPLVLLCATEHYGAVMNRPFDLEKYLNDAGEKKQTLTRLFTLFRELQSAINPYSTCKPESPDYIAPFARTGPGVALDGQPRFDLTKWNDEFFTRLHRFCSLAGEKGVIVEVVLLSNTYADNVWQLNPLNPANNINGVEGFHFSEYMSLRHANLWKWQSEHVRKIVQECNRYDNVFFEICNEPGGKYPGVAGAPDMAEVDTWQHALARVIRDTEKELPNKHLIAGQEAFTWSPTFIQTSDVSFSHEFPIDIVNMHPLPDTEHGGKRYDMGPFMSKQLKLAAVRDFAITSYGMPKPLNYDEDNSSTQYKDVEAWTIHRKRAWTTLFSGAHYDMIDFSILPYLETGTPMSQKYLRTWFRHLSEFIHSVDLVNARPAPGFLKKVPEHVVASVLAVDGEDYCVYLADGRELGAGVGEPIGGKIEVKLPADFGTMRLYSPETGLHSPALRIAGGLREIDVGMFTHDVVVRFQR